MAHAAFQLRMARIEPHAYFLVAVVLAQAHDHVGKVDMVNWIFGCGRLFGRYSIATRWPWKRTREVRDVGSLQTSILLQPGNDLHDRSCRRLSHAEHRWVDAPGPCRRSSGGDGRVRSESVSNILDTQSMRFFRSERLGLWCQGNHRTRRRAIVDLCIVEAPAGLIAGRGSGPSGIGAHRLAGGGSLLPFPEGVDLVGGLIEPDAQPRVRCAGACPLRFPRAARAVTPGRRLRFPGGEWRSLWRAERL